MQFPEDSKAPKCCDMNIIRVAEPRQDPTNEASGGFTSASVEKECGKVKLHLGLTIRSRPGPFPLRS